MSRNCEGAAGSCLRPAFDILNSQVEFLMIKMRAQAKPPRDETATTRKGTEQK